MIILANDGLSKPGEELLLAANFEVMTDQVAQESLADFINQKKVTVLLVRSATQVRKALIDQCPTLKVIGRGGVGMDNIDVEYAKEKGLQVINTPKASSHSVAELVFAHMFSLVRSLHDANRNMPLQGDTQFNVLKKSYSAGVELRGKTLGIIGLGHIGKAVAKVGYALGMRVLAYDPYLEKETLSIDFFDGQTISFEVGQTDKETLLKESDFVTLHIPAQKEYVIGKAEIKLLKANAYIINAARGGTVDEDELVKAANEKRIAGAALDVFEKEPKPDIALLMNQKLSLSPHIGAATLEAQERIGLELADQLCKIFA